MTLADEIERSGAFRDVIRASNRQESEIARLRDAFAAKSNRGERKLKLYHGTSLEAALRIESQGFQASATGCLGPGVYLARADKALRFAQEGGRHGGAEGGLVEVLVRFKNPKFVAADDDTWQAEGYDACRAEETSASQNMEWRCPVVNGVGTRYIAIPAAEERGKGLFECGDCGNVWTSNTACRSLKQYCHAENCNAREEMRGFLPKEIRAPEPAWLRARHAGRPDASWEHPAQALVLWGRPQMTCEC
ncbi:hypothetical protein EMIHUDRAFT_231247 [Emiliania huxleyi CCMP1516]|uniref:PARP catalytic domain-containing protein n=2 Tax=Emiliania huxleyi TaxID=2903 RepID=A0A0D3K7V2_EMIH1|nr:hypothetical protein EMIHUDRAFT_231247 [Emiliania huxleyi CCMP1516]EOD31837.1 hypothetical protein EMIHUDRAFT_231247 [Emiliania huxleyi CCMP1516]|eukprot:XP_005784266.1 hypothetical protein EMIHUDRAFT_231247 [Emiliania huxleyi CCMP1516]